MAGRISKADKKKMFEESQNGGGTEPIVETQTEIEPKKPKTKETTESAKDDIKAGEPYIYDANVEGKNYTKGDTTVPENMVIPELNVKPETFADSQKPDNPGGSGNPDASFDEDPGESKQPETKDYRNAGNINVSKEPGQPKKEKGAFFNPLFAGMNTDDKESGLDDMEDFTVMVLKQLKVVGYNSSNFERSKQIEKAMKGKFNMRLLTFGFELEDGSSYTLGSYIEKYNNDVACAFDYNRQTGQVELEPEFEKLFRKNIRAICKKFGVVSSPEQTLFGLMGLEVVKLLLFLPGAKMGLNSTIKQITDYSKSQTQDDFSNAQDIPSQPDAAPEQTTNVPPITAEPESKITDFEKAA